MRVCATDVNEVPVVTPVNVSFTENQANGTVLVPEISYVDQDAGDYSTFTLTRVCCVGISLHFVGHCVVRIMRDCGR